MPHGINEESGPCEPTENGIYTFPWKYTGYKGLTSFVASDQDFFALRRFDRLHTRVLLALQAQLRSLETQLDDLDARCASSRTKLSDDGLVDVVKACEDNKGGNLRDVNNGTVQDDLPVRQELVATIHGKLAEYDEMLIKYCSAHSLPAAPKRNIRNIEAWLTNNPGAIAADEADFINYRDELISISRPKSVLRLWFEEAVVLRTRDSLKLFRRSPERADLSDRDQKETYIVSDDAIEAFGSIAVFAAATGMLIVPLWLLQMLKNLQLKLAVITTCLFVWLVLLSCATLGRPFERLAATAGY
ncbi:hypothetical protein QQS21_002292 [Conoideocrella luteorostrata]|uniref:DUF6594 domain-containing protein n=1 Tax=Conoideocrella luteorostrata TaxID=1105319 RepID=A0AAJ0CVK2_9HYPO|nr:hypothetical protein QQS21_002292 [Conoideocrella luteorostrata]